MEFCVDGLHFFKKFKSVFNFVICLSALVIDLTFHHHKEISAIIVLLCLRLVRIVYSVYELTIKVEHIDYQNL